MPRPINDQDPFLSKLLKTIPTEIVGAYLFLCGVVGASNSSTSGTANGIYPTLITFIFIILLLLTPFYMWRIQGVKNWIHLLISTISFAVWVYTLGGINGSPGWFHLSGPGGVLHNGEGGPSGPAGIFLVLGIYASSIASTVLVLWTLISPLAVPPEPTPTPPPADQP